MTGPALALSFAEIGIADRATVGGKGATDQGRDPGAAGFRRHDRGLRALHC
jgi:hypothetical protein